MHNNRIDKIIWTMRAVICGARANNRAELWLSRLVFLVHLGVWFWLCFRLRREQAIMKRSGGGLPRAAWAGQPSLLGERRGKGTGATGTWRSSGRPALRMRRWHLNSLPGLPDSLSKCL